MEKGNGLIMYKDEQIADLLKMPMTINKSIPQSVLDKNDGIIASQEAEIAGLKAIM